MHGRRSVTQGLLLWRSLLAVIVLVFGSDVHLSMAAVSAPAVQAQLERARASARRLDYTGIVQHQQGPDSMSLRITHEADPGGGVVRVQPLEGPPRHMVRRGTQVAWYLPREKTVINDQLTGIPNFPELSFMHSNELLAHYRMRSLATDRVAGRDAQLFQLMPLDGLRYGYRLWFDIASGLLLRVQSISEAGQVVAQTGFSQLAVWPASAKRFRWSEPDVRGWKIERAVTGNADVAGWSFHLPQGFSQIAALRRNIRRSSGATEPRELVQIVCSDGLAGISIFIEPWSDAHSAQPVQRGAVNMLGKRVGRFWLTIVGETPMAALRMVADSVEFTAPALK